MNFDEVFNISDEVDDFLNVLKYELDDIIDYEIINNYEILSIEYNKSGTKYYNIDLKKIKNEEYSKRFFDILNNRSDDVLYISNYEIKMNINDIDKIEKNLLNLGKKMSKIGYTLWFGYTNLSSRSFHRRSFDYIDELENVLYFRDLNKRKNSIYMSIMYKFEDFKEVFDLVLDFESFKKRNK